MKTVVKVINGGTILAGKGRWKGDEGVHDEWEGGGEGGVVEEKLKRENETKDRKER